MSFRCKENEPLRGCQVCDFGRGANPPGESCKHPEVAGRVPLPSLDMRRFGSACGPEAKYLTIKGVQL